MRTLIQQAAWIPEDDVYLNSTHVHDYRSYTLRDGQPVTIDGGCEYRRYGPPELWETRVVDWCLYEDSPLAEVQGKLLWGCRGIRGDEPLHYRPISTLSRDHLAAILRTQLAANPLHLQVVAYWLDILDSAAIVPPKTL